MKRIVVVFILGMGCMLCKAQSNALSERQWNPLMEKAMEWVDENLDNGAYKGQLSNGVRSGLGVYQWSGGTWYWGRWRDGDKNGKGIYIVPEGYSVANCPGCVYFVGNYYSGKKSGKGTCYDKYGKLIYHGDFSDGRPTDVYPSQGYAGYKFECTVYSGGDMYIGETNNGTRHGYGIYLWTDGKAWYGPWIDGERAGYGILLLYKGNCQAGRWTNNTYTEAERACTLCRGKGEQLCTVCAGTGGYWYYGARVNCPTCMGRGKLLCSFCGGKGKVASGSTADEVFTKMKSRYAPTVSSSYGESSSSGESSQEVWDRARAYDEAGDYTKAVPLYRQLADQGVAAAQFNLGLCYANGQGVAQSYDEAVRWYRKAADQGVAEAQCNLGSCYANGQGVAQSYDEAVRWYRKAADQGVAVAQFNLGLRYVYGQGVEKSDTEAVKWYRKAAAQGYGNAMVNLGMAYKSGNGVEKDGNKALYWYKKGVKSGNAEPVRQGLAKAAIERLEKEGYSADRAGIR